VEYVLESVQNVVRGRVVEVAMHDGAADFARLIALVGQGSEDAARQLIAEHGDLVLRVVRKHLPHVLRRTFDSQDFVQVAWGSIFRHRSRLERFGAPRDFTAFLTAVAANKVRMEVRRRCQQKKHNVNRERPLNSVAGLSSSRDSTPSQVAMAREMWSEILKGQRPRYQEIIRLRYLGYSSREIASRIGLDAGSVRRILRHVFKGVM
jgi:RNA polymerase sigma factor (sigma-70 family)